MKRALVVLGLSAATLFTAASCGKDESPVTYPGGGTGGPGGPGATGGTQGGTGGPGTPGTPGAAAGGTTGYVDPGPMTNTDFIKDATDESGLDRGVIDGLKAGGTGCTTKVLYPYDGTVFPGALQSPPIMWEGAGGDAYVRVKYDNPTNVDFEWAAKAGPTGELRIPQMYWNELTRRSKGGNMLVTLSVRTGAGVSTCQLKWRVAQGNMIGSIYYNTYQHPMAGGVGAVLRLTLGRPSAEIYYKTWVPPIPGLEIMGPCVSCHSVSSSGNTLAFSDHTYGPVNSFASLAVPITEAPQPPNARPMPDATFGALTPDGKYILQMGNPQCTAGSDTFPRAPNNFPLVFGPNQASLVDTTTGQVVPTKGLDPNFYMWMPQFSPDGKHVVFNHAKPGSGGTDRRELAMMDFDQTNLSFSNLRVISTPQLRAVAGPEANPTLPYAPVDTSVFGPLAGGPSAAQSKCNNGPPAGQRRGELPSGACAGPCYPAWPFFTPDSRGVIFSLISEPDFTVAFPGRNKPSKSELWYVNIDSPAAPKNMKLDNANKALPGEDTLINYYPTVLPVQVGGYYWVFWTSTRNWGHRKFDPGLLGLGGSFFVGETAVAAFKKRIWVSAIRASGTSGDLATTIDSDPSFPGFYLEGQSESGNTRAFATLNPCKTDGNECTSGLDCCNGYCEIADGAGKGVCVPEKVCAKANEKCETDANCCPPASPDEPANSCIGGYCGFVVLE